MTFSNEIARFIVSNAAQNQVEIIYLTEILRDDLFSKLPEIADIKLVKSYEILKSNFKSQEDYQTYVQSRMKDTLFSFDKATWSSIFAYSFFTFERDLYALCKKIENEVDSNITVGDLDGKGIRSKKYLTKIAEFNFNELNEDWQDIIFFKEFRNCISHNGNSIKKSNRQDAIREYCENKNDISKRFSFN